MSLTVTQSSADVKTISTLRALKPSPYTNFSTSSTEHSHPDAYCAAASHSSAVITVTNNKSHYALGARIQIQNVIMHIIIGRGFTLMTSQSQSHFNTIIVHYLLNFSLANCNCLVQFDIFYLF